MKKVAFLFPGQGSQYVGMGEELYNTTVTAKEVFEKANEVLGFDIKELCINGNMEELTRTSNTQPAILTASYAAFMVFNEQVGIRPDILAGHSLGELTALTCSGAIRFEDAVRIVRKRGELMDEVSRDAQGSMAAVSNVGIDEIKEVCDKCSEDGNAVVISNYNSPEQIVISGNNEAVDKAGDLLKVMGAKVTPLKVGAAFHSPLMKEVSEQFASELEKYTFYDLNYPVVSNVTALPYEGKESIIENLTSQIVKPVRWIDTMEYLSENNIAYAVELGPKTVLRNMTVKNTNTISAYSFDRKSDVETMIKELLPKGQPQPMKVLTRSMAVAVCTRNSNWDNEEYDKGVVKPYKEIHKLVEALETENRQPSLAQMQKALLMLKSVFDTKRTERSEQIERLEQILGETGTGTLLEEFYRNTWKVVG